MTASDTPRTYWFGLTVVLAGAAALRFWGLSINLPFSVGADEPVIAGHALQILKSGDFNPHFFDYPGLYIYMQAAVGCVRFLSGAMNGEWRSLATFLPEHLFLWTRTLNALLGTATVYLVYRAAARWGRWTALLAAALLAVWMNHVRESHFALTDAPLAFLTTMTLVLSLRALESQEISWFLAAGAGAGLAAASKYTGAIALVMPLIAAWRSTPMSSRLGRAAAASGAAALAFLAGAPYTLLDLPGFLNAFAYMAAGSYQPRPLSSGLQTYFAHIAASAGWLGARVAGAGVIWAAVRAVREREVARWALLLVFPLVYLEVIATKQLMFARYMLPISPFLCLILAIVIVDFLTWAFSADAERWLGRWLGSWLWRRRASPPLLARRILRVVAVALALGIVVPVADAGISWTRRHGRRTTQSVAYGLVQSFIPPGSGIVVEHNVLRPPDSRYRVMVVERLTDRPLADYASRDITFVVASSDTYGPVFAHPRRNAEAIATYRQLFDDEQRCLPAVKPTAFVGGPEIRICRLTK